MAGNSKAPLNKLPKAPFWESLRYDSKQSYPDVAPFSDAVWKDELPLEYPTGQFTFLFAGPPKYALMKQNAKLLTPLGLVQDISYQAQRQLAPIPEIGNRYFRHIGGRWSHMANITRIMSLEGNLAGMLYRWVERQNDQYVVKATPEQSDRRKHIVTVESDMLNMPFGILVVRGNELGQAVSATYWEKCMIASMGEQISSGQVIITESVQIVMARTVAADHDGINYLAPLAPGSFNRSASVDSALAVSGDSGLA